MKILKYLFGLVLVIALFLLSAAFLTSNSQDIRVDMLFVPAFDVRLGVVLMVSFIIGGMIGLLASTVVIVKLKAEKMRLQRRLQNTSQMISGFGS